jgi:hypothetical protein
LKNEQHGQIAKIFHVAFFGYLSSIWTCDRNQGNFGDLSCKRTCIATNMHKKYKKVWIETKYVVCLQYQCHKNDI